MADGLTTTPIKKSATCRVDLLRNTASANGRAIQLTPMKAEILHVIVSTHPRPALLSFISERLTGIGEGPSHNSIQVQISQMRPKLAAIGVEILSLGQCRYGYAVYDPDDIPLITECDLRTIRKAIKVLQKVQRSLCDEVP